MELLRSTDEQQERGLVRSVLEFGIRPWNETETVADHLFREIEENDLESMFDNKQLVKVLDLYKTWYKEGLKPTDDNFIYHEDHDISQLVIQLMQELPPEINPKWKEIYQGHITHRTELYKEEVDSSLNYLKLRKIKKMISENQKEMMEEKSADQQMLLLRFHQQLKQMEMTITRQLGTVIYK